MRFKVLNYRAWILHAPRRMLSGGIYEGLGRQMGLKARSL